MPKIAISLFIIICLAFIVLTSCDTLDSKTSCVISNNTTNKITVNHLNGYVEKSQPVVLMPGIGYNFISQTRSIGETLSVDISINGINYTANTRYIQDYKSVTLTLYGNISYILSDPTGATIEMKDLTPQ